MPDLLEPIDGRKMACDAEMLFQITGDPIFRAVQDALEAYGLDKGEPTRSFGRLVYATDERWRGAPRAVEAIVAAAKERGEKGKLTPACAEVASDFGLDALSFDAAVHRLGNRVRAARHGDRSNPMDGDTGRRIFAKPVYSEPIGSLPPSGAEVPDTLYWRQKFYSGEVTAHFVSNSPPKKTKT